MEGFRVSRETIKGDLLAGLIMAIITLPGSLGNGLLAGVNPMLGVYSTIAGTTVAAFFTSSWIMNVDSTSATAIATGEEVAGLAPPDQLAIIVVLSILVGLFQLLFGLLKLGFLTRFISNSVMTGFLTGIGVLLILGQIGDLTGYRSDAANKVFQFVDTLSSPGLIHLPTLAVGLLSMVLVFITERGRFGRYAYAIALVVATVVVALIDPPGVATVGDTTSIPRELIRFHLPDLSLVVQLIAPALAIAIIVLVQSSGVSQSVPNPDGEYPNPDGDFRGQGLANVAAGFAGGIPVGGSLGGTAVLQQVGGKTRWANVFTGLFVAVAVLTIGPQIELIPLPALAGILVMVGFSMLNFGRMQNVYYTGPTSLGIAAVTFVATLFLPIQYAVAVGAVLHILIYVFASSEGVRIERLVHQPDGTWAEEPLPETLSDGEVYAMNPVGSLFFAGAAELEEQLPDTGDATNSVVILGLRDRDEVGSTFINVIKRYIRELEEGGNKLKLVGLNERVTEQLEKTGLLDLLGEEDVYPADKVLGKALADAEADALAWIAEQEAADGTG